MAGPQDLQNAVATETGPVADRDEWVQAWLTNPTNHAKLIAAGVTDPKERLQKAHERYALLLAKDRGDKPRTIAKILKDFRAGWIEAVDDVTEGVGNALGTGLTKLAEPAVGPGPNPSMMNLGKGVANVAGGMIRTPEDLAMTLAAGPVANIGRGATGLKALAGTGARLGAMGAVGGATAWATGGDPTAAMVKGVMGQGVGEVIRTTRALHDLYKRVVTRRVDLSEGLRDAATDLASFREDVPAWRSLVLDPIPGQSDAHKLMRLRSNEVGQRLLSEYHEIVENRAAQVLGGPNAQLSNAPTLQALADTQAAAQQVPTVRVTRTQVAPARSTTQSQGTTRTTTTPVDPYTGAPSGEPSARLTETRGTRQSNSQGGTRETRTESQRIQQPSPPITVKEAMKLIRRTNDPNIDRDTLITAQREFYDLLRVNGGQQAADEFIQGLGAYARGKRILEGLNAPGVFPKLSGTKTGYSREALMDYFKGEAYANSAEDQLPTFWRNALQGAETGGANITAELGGTRVGQGALRVPLPRIRLRQESLGEEGMTPFLGIPGRRPVGLPIAGTEGALGLQRLFQGYGEAE